MDLPKRWENPLMSLQDRYDAAIEEIERLTEGWRTAFNCGMHHQDRADKLADEKAKLIDVLLPFAKAFEHSHLQSYSEADDALAAFLDRNTITPSHGIRYSNSAQHGRQWPGARR